MRRTRVIYSDNGTLSDLTNDLHEYRTGIAVIPFVAAEDYLYVGNIAPFNHFYMTFATANTQSTTMTVEYWGGKTWHPVVELIDGTNGFQQDGFVEFTPDRDAAWIWQDTDDGVDGLTSITIYDKYWVRVKFNNDMDAGTSISWLGQKFSDDDDLRSEFPDLVRSNVLTAFEAGKTTWEEQHVRAAELIIKDLINKKVIFSKDQVLERDTFRLASVSKTAEMIYSSFGDDYLDQVRAARSEYTNRMKSSVFDVDLNQDGELSRGELRTRQGFMFR